MNKFPCIIHLVLVFSFYHSPLFLCDYIIGKSYIENLTDDYNLNHSYFANIMILSFLIKKS